MPVPDRPEAAPPQPSILARTARGAGWIFAFRAVTRVIGTASTLILAMLLLPVDFGLVALGTAFMQSVEILAYVGVEDALVREKSPDRAMYDTGFTLNLLRGGLMALVLIGLAIPVAEFYHEPELINVLIALGIAAMLEACGNIGMVDFRRNFEFDREFIWLTVPRLVQVVVMITGAFYLRSYWALIMGVLVLRVVKLVMGYRMHPYRPRLTLSAWRHLLGYSAWSWAVSIAILLREKLPTVLIGRILEPQFVGMFTIGSDLAGLPVSELVAPASRAAFSGFSAGRREGVAAAETYINVVSVLAAVTLPAGIGLSMVADPLVRLALGPSWLESVPMIELLGLHAAIAVYGYLGWTLFFSYGRLLLVFGITITSALARAVLMFILLPRYGLVGAAWAILATALFEDVAYIHLLRRNFGTSVTALIAQSWRPFAATAAMAIVMHLLRLGWVPTSGSRVDLLWHIILAVPTGAAIYGASLLALWAASGKSPGPEADMLAYLRRRLSRR